MFFNRNFNPALIPPVTNFLRFCKFFNKPPYVLGTLSPCLAFKVAKTPCEVSLYGSPVSGLILSAGFSSV